MKTNKSWLTVLGLSAVVAGLAATPAGAACSTSLQVPVGHSQDDYFACDDKGPVGFYAYSLATAAPDLGANSNGQSGVCTANDPSQTTAQGTPCTNPNAGGVGDGHVNVQYDWGSLNPGSVGCPSNSASVQGAEPVAFHVIGTNGKSALISVGYDIGFGGYLVDQAFQVDLDAGVVLPYACNNDNAPLITSASAGPSPSISNVCVHLNPTKAATSCDAGALGSFDFGAGAPCGAGQAGQITPGRGRLYIKTQSCTAPGDLRLSANWVLAGVQPNAAGDACNPITTTAGQCTYIGATGTINGTETAAVAGALLVGQAAASDHVKIDKAGFDKNQLVVNFSTTNETSIVSFNVYAGSTKLNSGPIRAQGTGSNSYTYQTARGDVKANKTVTVEAVKSDGSVEKSSPVSLK